MSIYCENCEEAGEMCEDLLAKAHARIAELEKALRPFAEAADSSEAMQQAATHLSKNAVAGASAYVWWASKKLCIKNFTDACKALGL